MCCNILEVRVHVEFNCRYLDRLAKVSVCYIGSKNG